MEKLHKLDLTRLRHAEFAQMIVRFYEDFNSTHLKTEDDADFKTLYDALEVQLPTFNNALNQVQASEESKEIAQLDRKRDAALQNVRNAIKPYRNSSDATETAAYTALSLLLSEYKDTEGDSLEAETNKLKTLAARLESAEYSTFVSDLGIGKFTTRMADANHAFHALFAQRSYKTAQKKVFNVKALRNTMTSDYQQMINYIAALAAVKKAKFYHDIFNMINNGRSYFSSVILARKGPKKPPPPPES